MKFNEKLIDLRKKAGLSQEELGEKLNVTRQTVSKWELGQTTPEMDKLSELGKLFNVSIDSLINDTEQNIVEDKNVETNVIQSNVVKENKPEKTREKTVVAILVVLLVVAIGMVAFIAIDKSNEKTTDDIYVEQAEGFIDKIFNMVMGIFDKTTANFDDINDQMGNIIDETNKNNGNIIDKIAATVFNGAFEMYGGTSSSIQVDRLLTEVNNNNKKSERKVKVVFNNEELEDELSLAEIQSKLTGNYLVTFDYDEQQYINKLTIKRVYTEMDKSMFNSSLELYQGVFMGGACKAALNDVARKNSQGERKITVVYGNTSTQEVDKINGITAKLDTFTNYAITYEYDEDGFINKMIIKKA